MRRKPLQKFTRPQGLKLGQMSEEELSKRLFLTILSIVGIIIVITASLMFFAPKIGGLFVFVSRHYYEKETETEIVPASPLFVDAPEATKEEKINIQGVSEPGMSIKLFVNGPEVQSTIADAEGKFTFVDIPLIKGKNMLYAKAVNSKSVESEKSETINIAYDNTAPEITVDQPKNGETVRNLDKRILVKGKVSEKATVRINERQAILKPDLTFELIIGVEEGSITINVEAIDMAGNKKEEKVTVKYVKSS